MKSAFADKTIMSIKEARELMPDTTAKMSDEQVSDFIDALHMLASSLIEMVRDDRDFMTDLAYNR